MIIYVGQSIDGYIADKNGQVTFLEQFESITTSTNNNIKNSYQNFIKDINVIVQGKTTYNQNSEIGSQNMHCLQDHQTPPDRLVICLVA
jgi:hypothetical protein